MEDQALAEIRVGGVTFELVAKAKEWILTAPLDTQYNLQAQLVDQVLDHCDQVESELVGLYEWVNQGKTYKHKGLSKSEHLDHLEDACHIVNKIKSCIIKEGKANVSRAKEKCTRIRGKLLAQQIDLWDMSGDYGKTFFVQLATIFSKASSQIEGVEIINFHMRDYITNPKRGQGSDVHVKATDLTKALSDIREKAPVTWLVLDKAILKKQGATYSAYSLLEPLASGSDPRLVPVFEDEAENPRPQDKVLEPLPTTNEAEAGPSEPAPAPELSALEPALALAPDIVSALASVSALVQEDLPMDSPILEDTMEEMDNDRAPELSKDTENAATHSKETKSPQPDTIIGEEVLLEESEDPADLVNIASKALMNTLIGDNLADTRPSTPNVLETQPLATPGTMGSLDISGLGIAGPSTPTPVSSPSAAPTPKAPGVTKGKVTKGKDKGKEKALSTLIVGSPAASI